MKKNVLVIGLNLILCFTMVGCGDSSGESASATTTTNVGQPNNTVNTNNTAGTTINPGTMPIDPSFPTNTPLSYGESSFPQGDIDLAFQTTANSAASAQGSMTLRQDYGFADCTIKTGEYQLITSQQGQVKTATTHNYGGITLGATGPTPFTAILGNALAMENSNGKWVLHAVLNVSSVEGKTCPFPVSLSFSMPLAQ